MKTGGIRFTDLRKKLSGKEVENTEGLRQDEEISKIFYLPVYTKPS